MPAHHLVTHSVVLGMTGSGKTGLVTVLVEERIYAQVPVLVIDVKGDLPNLLLAFAATDPTVLEPWVEVPPAEDTLDGRARFAANVAARRQADLAEWGIGDPEIATYNARRSPTFRSRHRFIRALARVGRAFRTRRPSRRSSWERCDRSTKHGRAARPPPHEKPSPPGQLKLLQVPAPLGPPLEAKFSRASSRFGLHIAPRLAVAARKSAGVEDARPHRAVRRRRYHASRTSRLAFKTGRTMRS